MVSWHHGDRIGGPRAASHGKTSAHRHVRDRQVQGAAEMPARGPNLQVLMMMMMMMMMMMIKNDVDDDDDEEENDDDDNNEEEDDDDDDNHEEENDDDDDHEDDDGDRGDDKDGGDTSDTILDAFSHLYKRVCPSVRPSVHHARDEFLKKGLNLASGI